MNGYLSPLYAMSLAEFGRPVFLPRSNGWLLRRPIPGSPEHDAIGCYPLFHCRDWASLAPDLEELAALSVAVSLVVDPFAPVAAAALHSSFPDVCRPFKEHAVVDFSRDWRASICRHHRRNVRAAARRVEVDACENVSDRLTTWIDLYSQLSERHAIRGIARFSAASFRQQLRVPGIVGFSATVNGETAGMTLWYVADEVAYYHLGALSSLGYESRAAFALFDVALGELAARGVRWATLGAAAGWQQAADDGLARFKNGWANDRRTAWFCGRILAPAKYERLAAAQQRHAAGWFPQYRLPEAA